MRENRKKIAYITGRFPHVSTTFTYKEVIYLKKTGLNIQVYSTKRPDTSFLTSEMKKLIKETFYYPSFLSPEILVAQLFFLLHTPFKYLSTMLKILGSKYKRYNNIKLKIRSFINFIRGVYLAFKLKKEQDFLHIHSQFETMDTTLAFIANKLISIPYSFRSHTCFNPDLIYEKVNNALFVISSSEYDKKRLISWTSEEFSDKIIVNYLGVDVDEFNVERDFEKRGLIVSVGRLVEKKGFEYLIEAAKILKAKRLNFLVKIGGGGPLRQKLEKMIQKKELADNIEILGYISHHKVRDLVKEASIFCQPCIEASNRDVDVFPVTSMEAMSLGKPVVSTNVSAIPEGIEDGKDGILVPQKDTQSLASALEKLLNDKELRKQIGNRARKRIESDFNIQKNIEELAKIFKYYIEDRKKEKVNIFRKYYN